MENIYITSDIHYSHKNIVGGITKWRNEQGEIPSDRVRNFETLEDMNYALVDNINKVVGENDILYFLGDLTLSNNGTKSNDEFIEQIKCKNKYLILGNHDMMIRKYRDYFLSDGKFKLIAENYYLKIDDKIIYLTHKLNTNLRLLNENEYHLHGHFHNRGEIRFTDNRSMDIGIDGNENFEPYKLIDVLNLVDKQYIKNK